jgi:hypothetical protein
MTPLSMYLTVQDQSTETVSGGEPTAETFIGYYGSVQEGRTESMRTITTFNDSIRFRSLAPDRYTALLSRDTIYAVSKDGRSFAQNKESGMYDSMLACLFSGPALRITLEDGGVIQDVFHIKENCPGGIYGRLNLPASVGIYLLEKMSEPWVVDRAWEEERQSPGFTGLRYSPTVVVHYKTTVVGSEDITVKLTADTTISDLSLSLSNNETVHIISHRIRLDGVMVVGKSGRLAHDGEVWIEEEIRYRRPDVSRGVLRRSSKRVLRMKIS